MMIFETGKGHPELAFVIELQCKFFQSGFDLDNEQCPRPGQSVVTQRNSFLDCFVFFSSGGLVIWGATRCNAKKAKHGLNVTHTIRQP